MMALTEVLMAVVKVIVTAEEVMMEEWEWTEIMMEDIPKEDTLTEEVPIVVTAEKMKNSIF